jgi:hypothetical protein
MPCHDKLGKYRVTETNLVGWHSRISGTVEFIKNGTRQKKLTQFFWFFNSVKREIN